MEEVTHAFGFFTEYKDAIDGLKNLGLMAAGIIGLYFLAKRANAQELASKAADRQAATAEKGHVTDQYIKAIDQLGATHSDGQPNIEVRLGGIYGLEQVAKESDELYPQIVEVLTAYVRTNAVDASLKKGVHQNEDLTLQEYEYKPKLDVQAVVTVLGRREVKSGQKPLDFSKACLSGYSFYKGDFTDSLFYDVDVSDANFYKANCANSIFTESVCERTNFGGADCSGAFFDLTRCNKANFRKSNCTKADFFFADCSEANFGKADCSKARFLAAVCRKTDFSGANCSGVDFSKAKVPPSFDEPDSNSGDM